MMDMMVLIVGVMTAAGELTYPIVDTNQLGFYGTSGGAIAQPAEGEALSGPGRGARGHGPQGDDVRILNFARAVRDVGTSAPDDKAQALPRPVPPSTGAIAPRAVAGRAIASGAIAPRAVANAPR